MLPLSALWLDIGSKAWVLSKLERPGDQITVIEGFFYIKLAYNPGAIFGIMQNANPWLRGSLFLFVGLAAISYFGWEYLKSTTPTKQRIALGLILGGALGNGLDRLFRGYVVDFLDFWFGSWEYWIFNFADSFILSGTVLYCISLYLEHKNSKKAEVA